MLTAAWNAWVGRFLIRLTVADGSPEPVIRPVAPLMISTRSKIAMSVLVVP
ncbi:hypothetical protein D9M71_767650 [compost metagenome]